MRLGLVLFAVVLVLAVPMAAPLLAYLANVTSHATIRYKLDVALLVDGQPVTGSVVQQLVIRGGGGSGQGTILATVSHVSGQALMLRMSGRPAMLVLMSVNDGDEDTYDGLLQRACGIKMNEEWDVPRYVAELEAFKGACEVPRALLPDIVAISDTSIRETIRDADPGNLPVAFGPGIELIGATISTTDEPLSRGIRSDLPWLSPPLRDRNQTDLTKPMEYSKVVVRKHNDRAFVSDWDGTDLS